MFVSVFNLYLPALFWSAKYPTKFPSKEETSVGASLVRTGFWYLNKKIKEIKRMILFEKRRTENYVGYIV